MSSVIGVYILDVEGAVLQRFLYTVDPADADAMRRRAPVWRDAFDNFVFEATRWAVGEAHADSFSGACLRYRAAASMGRPVPLVPLDVVEKVGSIVSRWQRRAPVGIGELSEEEAQLRSELYSTVGGDHGDSPGSAGLRMYSQMWSARISDGFVHPAVGAHIWRINPATIWDDGAESRGPLIAALDIASALANRWEDEPDSRANIERQIMRHAHSLGWQ